MPTRRAMLACALLTLLAQAHAHAQSAVLLLTPAPTTAVRAGTGASGFSGDGGSATAARFASPNAMVQDAQGNLYLSDTRNHRIRRIAPDGTVTTLAGTGVQGFSGDGGTATKAQLDSPSGIAVDGSGAVYIADTRNRRIRKIDTTGTIQTIAGTGSVGSGGDGGPATSATLAAPQGLALSPAGDLYIADTGNHRVRRIAADGTLSTFAGSGAQGDSGDEGAATAAMLNAPAGLAVRSDGALLIADRGNNRVRVVTTDGIMHALDAGGLQLRRPRALALTPAQDVLVADSANFRVAQISSTGAGTALGSGVQGSIDSTVTAALSPFGSAVALATDAAGGFVALDHDRGQAVQVSLPTLTFPDTVVASTSPPLTLALRNGSGGDMTVTAVTVPTGFAQSSSSCGATPFPLPASGSCNVGLVFTPTAEGAVSGTVQVSVGGGAPQRAVLTGSGVRTGTLLASSTSLQSNGSISYAGTAIALTAQVLGTSTPVPTGAVTFLDGTQELGTSPLNATAQATLTTSSLVTGAHALTARFSGDSVYGSSTSLALQQTVVLAPDFTFSTLPASRVALNSGDAGAVSLTLQPVNGVLNHVVAMQVAGLPTGSTVNMTPSTVILASDPVPVAITFKLPVTVTLRRTATVWAACLLCGVFLLRRRKRSWALAALLPLLSLQGCGGGYTGNASSVSSQSVGQTYPVTVTASTTGVSGETLTHTATFTVVVQP